MNDLYEMAMEGPAPTTDEEIGRLVGRMMDRSIDFLGAVLTDELTDEQSERCIDGVNTIWNMVRGQMLVHERGCYPANTFKEVFAKSVDVLLQETGLTGQPDGQTV